MSEVENKRTMRPLESGDLFLLTAIIGKIGVKNIARCFSDPEVQVMRNEEDMSDEQRERLGQLIFFGVIDVVLERLEYCEDAICRLLSRLYGMPEKDIKAMGAGEYLDMFIAVVKDEHFTDFFKQAYESVKRMM